MGFQWWSLATGSCLLSKWSWKKPGIESSNNMGWNQIWRSILYFLTHTGAFNFSKCAFIFKECFHFRKVLSFSKCAFIFEMCFHFRNVLSFSKCASHFPFQFHFNVYLSFHYNINGVIVLLNTPKNGWKCIYTSLTFHNTQHKSLFSVCICKKRFVDIYHIFASVQLLVYLLPTLS